MNNALSPPRQTSVKPAVSDQPAIRIFERLLHGYEVSAALRLWNDTIHERDVSPAFTLVVRNPMVLRLWCRGG